LKPTVGSLHKMIVDNDAASAKVNVVSPQSPVPNRRAPPMKLLEPINIGPIRLKNRVVSTAHAAFTDFFRPDCNGERYMAYQERRARGGTGLLIMTAMHVHRASQMLNHWVFDAATMAPKFRRISERVHGHGAKIFAQVFHFGVMGKGETHDDLGAIWGFSPLESADGEACHVMTDAEIEEVIDAFVASSVCAVENGIDGIELHATHGYLIQQSYSPYANRRTDKWGQRLYFVTELARRIRAGIGRDRAMGIRVTLDDFKGRAQGGLDFEDILAIVEDLVKTGLFDYVNTSEGSGNFDYARVISSYRHGFGKTLPAVHALKARINSAIPVIGVNKIPTVDLAEHALINGDCDLVGMTRAQIADPDLVYKLEHGQAPRIRTCTGANQGCIDRVAMYPITCIQNPEVGQEAQFAELDKVRATPKRVLVIGGGPAGMKAAEIAARRGHQVTLAEAGHRLGGRFNLVEKLGAAANLLSMTAWIEEEIRRLQVRVLLQTRVDEKFIRDLAPDAIIVATGARAKSRIELPNDGSVPVIDIDSAVQGQIDGETFDMKGTNALLLDLRGNYETALAIDALVQRGAKLTVVTQFLHYGANLGFTMLDDYLRLLPKWGVRVLTMSRCTNLTDGHAHVTIGSTGQQERIACDFVVAGVPPAPVDDLNEMCGRYASTKVVGDAYAPRSAMEAIREADRAARLI